MKQDLQILFTPAQIGACMLKNRFVMAPMGPAGLADAQGAFTQTGIDFYVERAKGAWASSSRACATRKIPWSAMDRAPCPAPP